MWNKLLEKSKFIKLNNIYKKRSKARFSVDLKLREEDPVLLPDWTEASGSRLQSLPQRAGFSERSQAS